MEAMLVQTGPKLEPHFARNYSCNLYSCVWKQCTVTVITMLLLYKLLEFNSHDIVLATMYVKYIA